jgi:hypothetical protein
MGKRAQVIDQLTQEWLKCSESCWYFLDTYGHIYDATDRRWVRFALWPRQVDTLEVIVDNRLVIILKARQLGLTWLTLGYALWLMLFRPAATVLLFSRRDDEAVQLLERLKGMYRRIKGVPIVDEATLPGPRNIETDNTHVWELSNGSIAYCFPTTAGDSYTATLAIVDEADLIPDLDALMNAVKPTIDGGGQMILLSRSNKDTPNSPFKRMFVAAAKGESPWKSVFLPWYTRPSRTQKWYKDQEADSITRTGSKDDLYQQYPATPEEALQARTSDKRIPVHWLEKRFVQYDITEPNDVPGINGLEIYVPPDPAATYVIGADPAEGNPNSDDSALTVMDANTGEEVAALADKIEPTVFALDIADISEYYNNASVLVERNNHGHAVIQYLNENTSVEVLPGWDDKPGYLTNSRGKAEMWTKVAENARDDFITIHSIATYLQLVSIEGATLRAPAGSPDDRAVCYALATIGAELVIEYAYGGIHV